MRQNSLKYLLAVVAPRSAGCERNADRPREVKGFGMPVSTKSGSVPPASHDADTRWKASRSHVTKNVGRVCNAGDTPEDAARKSSPFVKK
jgi:hypothetical protein